MPFHMKTINTPISIRWKRSDKRKSQLGVTKEGGTTKGSPEEGKNALDTREQDYKQDRKYEMG
jgi:hypothetical protein